MAVILWNKKYTETLSQTIERFRREKKEFQNEKVTYAGRLDPMAEGLLILLTGDDVHRKQEFLDLPKVYEIDFFFGLTTDTYDILGLITEISHSEKECIDENIIQKQLTQYLGQYEQVYPAYSSKTVQGKSLFMWAREGNVSHISLPIKKVKIFDIQFLGRKSAPLSLFKENLIQSILKVNGDFRQKHIIKKWEDFFQHNTKAYIDIYTIRVSASSGTYMRSLIYRLGKDVSIPACSLKIKRIQVGHYFLENL